MNDKLKEHHLERKAVLYIRQSSPHQVTHNVESQRLQYAMQERLNQLGWTDVELIDEDLGKSAAGAADRTGFERMVAEVCLGKVGAVAAREVSRFARNSRDWQQLVEVCRMVDTLLVDHETIYDPRRGNDRLLLGVKGSLNEYELDVLRMRSLEARLEKARRGELIVMPPAGFLKADDDKLVKDPDRRVQSTISRTFKKFLELGTVRQTMLWFLEQGLEFPVRRHGSVGWETVWRRPSYQVILKVLKNPIYAGTYVYGKTESSVEYDDGELRKKVRNRPMERWLAMIYHHHEGYVEPKEFERIQAMIAKNAHAPRGGSGGAAKTGCALLSGLLRCGACGRKLMVIYTGREHNVPRYVCRRGHLDSGEPRCLSVGGRPVDDAVSKQALRVVQPGAIEAARLARQQARSEQDDALDALRLDLEAARYAADRASRQYDAADPSNRLVADELERRWNSALQKIQGLEQRIEETEKEQCQDSSAQPEDLTELALDLERVWCDSATDVRLKKRILRTLIEEIVVNIDDKAGESQLVIHWNGGVHTDLRVARRRRGQNGLHTAVETVDAVQSLTRICSDEVIAGILSRNGLRTGRGNRWTRERVTSLRSKRGIARHCPERQEAEGWMNLTQAAVHAGVNQATLRRAVARGEIEAEHPLPEGPWVFQREHLDQPAVRKALDSNRRSPRKGTTHTPGDVSLFDTTT